MSWSPQFQLSVSECAENDTVTCQSTRQNTTSSSSSSTLVTGDQQLVDNTTTSSTSIPTLSPQILVADVAFDDVAEIPSTPTMPCNRIPEIEQCPPAPFKPKSRPTLKRKLLYSDDCVTSILGNNINNINDNNNVNTSSNSNSNNVTRLLDFSKEVESMFPPPIQLNFGCKIKKARSI